jgi:hypothetical protein
MSVRYIITLCAYINLLNRACSQWTCSRDVFTKQRIEEDSGFTLLVIAFALYLLIQV